MLDGSKFILQLQGVFFFIELDVYKCISSTLIRNCPSNEQKLDNKDNVLSQNYTMMLWKWQ